MLLSRMSCLRLSCMMLTVRQWESLRGWTLKPKIFDKGFKGFFPFYDSWIWRQKSPTIRHSSIRKWEECFLKSRISTDFCRILSCDGWVNMDTPLKLILRSSPRDWNGSCLPKMWPASLTLCGSQQSSRGLYQPPSVCTRMSSSFRQSAFELGKSVRAHSPVSYFTGV